MATQTTFPITDLVLRVFGGQRDGELIPVKTPKCFLGIQADSGGSDTLPRCAIFRGPQGAAVRSYADEVTINGVGATTHWLEQGDQIEFPNSIAVEVTQIGSVQPSSDDWVSLCQPPMTKESLHSDSNLEAAEPRSAEPDQPLEPDTQKTTAEPQPFDLTAIIDEVDPTPDGQSHECKTDASTCCEPRYKAPQTSETPDAELPISESTDVAADFEAHQVALNEELDALSSLDSVGEIDKRLEWVESQIREIKSQNCQSQENVEKLNQKLDDLCDQISRMVSFPDGAKIANVESESSIGPQQINDTQEPETFVTRGEGTNELTIDSIAADQGTSLDDHQTADQGASLDDHQTADQGTSLDDHQTADHEAIPDSNPHGEYDLANDFYAYAQDDSDDERIVTFDPESTDSTETIEAADHVEITDTSPELNGTTQAEIDSRIAEMERVFGKTPSESESHSDFSSPTSEEFPGPPLTRAITPTQPLNSELETAVDNSKNESTSEHMLPHAADDLPDHKFETLTHGQNEGLASFAANPTKDEQEPLATRPLDKTELDILAEPGLLARQLMQEVESSIQDELGETPTEAVSTQSTSDPDGGQAKNESVSDLLARLQSEGQWSGIEADDDEKVQPIEPVALQPEPADEQPANVGDSEEDVEDYMSQLLSRMRGGEPVSSPTSAAKPKQTKQVKPTEEPVILPPTNPLKAEEFVPKLKATKIESFDAMRELANSSARSAVLQSEEGRRKALGYLQVGIAVASFVMSVYYLVMASNGLFDASFCIGLVCLSISGFLGYRYYMTIKHNELVVDAEVVDITKPADEPNATSENLG